ncbi:MAG: hypothetical protein VX899_11900 [Myxococcota bacterium]|nr:hypothetical protein [Myxococcota bacterium]
MYALIWTLACTGEDTSVDSWRIEPRASGTPLARSSAYPLDDGSEAYLAAQHIVPELHWGNSPSTHIVLDMWDHVMGVNVADPGNCPYDVVDGSTRTWTGGCRSQDGYDWEGEVQQVVWEEEGQEWERWTFDMVVSSEVDSRSFDRIAFQGEFWFAGSNGEDLQSHTESNFILETEGYWERGSRPKLEEAWSVLAFSGIWETWLDAGGDLRSFKTEGVFENAYGGLVFATPELLEDDGCASEPSGTLSFTDGDQKASLEFEGNDRCDNCASYALDGEDAALTCRTSTWL